MFWFNSENYGQTKEAKTKKEELQGDGGHFSKESKSQRLKDEALANACLDDAASARNNPFQTNPLQTIAQTLNRAPDQTCMSETARRHIHTYDPAQVARQIRILMED